MPRMNYLLTVRGGDAIPGQVITIYNALPCPINGTRSLSLRTTESGRRVGLRRHESTSRRCELQLSDWYWLPREVDAGEALMIDYRPSDVTWMCTSAKLVGRLTVPYGVEGLEQGAPVTLCHLNAPLTQLWDRLRNFS